MPFFFQYPCLAALLVVVVVIINTVAQDAPKPNEQPPQECTKQPPGITTPTSRIMSCGIDYQPPAPELGYKCSPAPLPTYPNLKLDCPEIDGKKIKEELAPASCIVPSAKDSKVGNICCMPKASLPPQQYQNQQAQDQSTSSILGKCGDRNSLDGKTLAEDGYKCCSWIPPVGEKKDVVLNCPGGKPAPYLCVKDTYSFVCCGVANDPDILGGKKPEEPKPADKPADKPAQ